MKTQDKPYFTKYLPVEDEIKEGDYIIYSTIKNSVPIQWMGGDLIGTEKKVKLSLCSRDIKDDDVYHNTLTNEESVKSVKDFTGSKTCFKVIGEVSPNAIWIKEGMEFSEEEIGFFVSFWSNISQDFTETNVKYEEWLKIEERKRTIRFKCPTCNTFH